VTKALSGIAVDISGKIGIIKSKSAFVNMDIKHTF
jgi:hypothetical protein